MLLEEQSFTRAAKRRHVTQPAFSRRIRMLENWLGVALIDRTTKPVSMLASGKNIEDGARDLVNRLYALRNNLQADAENEDRITFITQHTLAISRFPGLIRTIKDALPDTAYRVNSVDTDACEALFLKEGHFLLCYETSHRSFDFPQNSVRRITLKNDALVPVASAGLVNRSQGVDALCAGKLPLLMYQPGGFFSDALMSSCLPAVFRDFRIEVICESAFSASLKEMVLADMGIAWLSRDMTEKEMQNQTLVSLEHRLGTTELDVLLYYREDATSEQARQVFTFLQSSLSIHSE